MEYVLIGVLVLTIIGIITGNRISSNVDKELIQELKKQLSLKEEIINIPKFIKIKPINVDEYVVWCKNLYEDNNFAYTISTIEDKLKDKLIYTNDDNSINIKYRLQGVNDFVEYIIGIVNKTQTNKGIKNDS